MEFLYLSFIAILFWFFQKIADWHNEHWLNWFKWAWVFFGIICWLFWAYLISFSEILQISYLSLIIFWLFAWKIDYINHIIAFIIIIIWMELFWKNDFNIYFYSFIIWFIYYIFKFIKESRFENAITKKFFKYRLQFYIIPIFASLYFNDIFWIIVVFNLLWVYLANKIFKIKQ